MRVSSDVVFRLGDKLIVGKNNYQTLCFNGETGEIVDIDASNLTLRMEDARASGSPNICLSLRRLTARRTFHMDLMTIGSWLLLGLIAGVIAGMLVGGPGGILTRRADQSFFPQSRSESRWSAFSLVPSAARRSPSRSASDECSSVRTCYSVAGRPAGALDRLAPGSGAALVFIAELEPVSGPPRLYAMDMINALRAIWRRRWRLCTPCGSGRRRPAPSL